MKIFILPLYFDFYKILITLNADNTQSCTCKSYLKITLKKELKELQEFLKFADLVQKQQFNIAPHWNRNIFVLCLLYNLIITAFETGLFSRPFLRCFACSQWIESCSNRWTVTFQQERRKKSEVYRLCFEYEIASSIKLSKQ